jgi:hypothetical protein
LSNLSSSDGQKERPGIMRWSHQRDAEGMSLGPTVKIFIYLFNRVGIL